jgi:hypothetical protein
VSAPKGRCPECRELKSECGCTGEEEGVMSHDLIKAAARRRMTETGEPYSVARRAVIAERQAAQAADEEASDTMESE